MNTDPDRDWEHSQSYLTYRPRSVNLGNVRSILGVALALTLIAVAGCGEEKLNRYQVSGTVTYGGQKVKSAAVNFSPDTSKGNKGPGSISIASDGAYQTLPTRGVVGGPYKVTISPLDAEGSRTPSFPTYETSIDLPKADSTYDFDMPKQ